MTQSLYTDFFVELKSRLTVNGSSCNSSDIAHKQNVKSDEPQPASLDEVLSVIQTIEDYEDLVSVMEGLVDRITIRFLSMFFESLVAVEERVWANSVGKYPPIRQIYNENCDLLLDNYRQFAFNYESAVVAWTKKDGMFYDREMYKFIQKRNAIYTRYVVIADKVLNA